MTDMMTILGAGLLAALTLINPTCKAALTDDVKPPCRGDNVIMSYDAPVACDVLPGQTLHVDYDGVPFYKFLVECHKNGGERADDADGEQICSGVDF
jgi:hypothetical protein